MDEYTIENAVRRALKGSEFRKTLREVIQETAIKEGPSSSNAWELVVHHLITSIYKVLLNRHPEETAINYYGERIINSGAIDEVLSDVLTSAEFKAQYEDLQIRDMLNQEITVRESGGATIFLHVQKTGGTSLQNMLVEKFAPEHVFRRDDILHLISTAETSKYDLFMGHYNYDSIKYIVRDKKSLITVLREPNSRLISLYKFWRAHTPFAPAYHVCMQLASELSFSDFVNSAKNVCAEDVWNHMTFVIMGRKTWQSWREKYLVGHYLKDEWLAEFKELARARLEEFTFVGLQEKFESSAKMLARKIGVEELPVRRDHSLTELIKNSSEFTNREDEGNLDHHTAPQDTLFLDKLLYAEAVEKFNQDAANLI